MITGTVKSFNKIRGYGYITIDDSEGKEVFVHQKRILGNGYNTLYKGQRVQFNLDWKDQDSAIDVMVIS